jgi:HD-GYP domain-containing protein (c-di-GMP phosphodiesterase class II)
VADAFDAMTSTRAYRPAMGYEAALAEIERGSGGQFDPAAAEALVSAVRAGNAAAAPDGTLTASAEAAKIGSG